MKKVFFNQTFNKGRLKTVLIWCIINFGENQMINLAENLKFLGFTYATNAGISLGIDDLRTISTKYKLVKTTNQEIQNVTKELKLGKITEVEQSEKLIDNWQKISEILKKDINEKFHTTNKLNPIFMMAFSGARGNISQVRQLIGMRGLMADPNGQIIQLPIKSNFREGLNVTEYLISCYGARKGVVDTALRTATAGYLTRRLVDTTQHVIISELDCGTKQGVFLSNLYQNKQVILSLKDQLYGRTIGENIIKNGLIQAFRNQQIDDKLSSFLSNNFQKIFIRSCLSCQSSNLTICQLCYGWNLSHSKLISLGEVVGIIAAQSIGEPGTQLTMRTFHTGGVFSGGVSEQMYAPFNGAISYSSSLQGITVVTHQNKSAFLINKGGFITIVPLFTNKTDKMKTSKKFLVYPQSIVFVKNREKVKANQLIAQLSSQILTDDQVEAKYMVSSKVEGEIYFDNFTFTKTKNNQLSEIRQKNRIWVLFGKIYKSLFHFKMFPKVGDIISYKFPLGQIELLNPSSSFLQSLLIRKKQKDSLNCSFKQHELFLFTEYPLYNLNLKNIRTVNNFSFLSSRKLKNHEIRRVKRIIKKHLFQPNYKVPYNKFSKIKKKVKKYLFSQVEQQTFFSKKMTSPEYQNNVSNINKSDSLMWFLPHFYFNKSTILQYDSTIKQNHNLNKFSNFSFLLKERKTFLYQNKIPKENYFFVKKKIFHFFLTSSDFTSLIVNQNTNLNIQFVKSKLLFLTPYSSLKYFINNNFLKLLNHSQKQFFIQTASIVKTQISSTNQFYKKPKYNKKNYELYFINNNNYFIILLYCYLFPYLIKNRKLSKTLNNYKCFYNFLFSFHQKYILIILFSLLQSLINNFFCFQLKYKFKIFYNTKLIAKIIPNFIYQITLPLTVNKNSFLLINQKNFLSNKSFINLISISRKGFNQLYSTILIQKKIPLVRKNFLKRTLSNNFNNSLKKLSNSSSGHNAFVYRQVLKLSVYDGLIYLTYLKQKFSKISSFINPKSFINRTFFSNSYFYYEKIQLPKLFKEYKTIQSKLVYWNSNEKSFSKKYFFIGFDSSFISFIKPKTKIANNIFDFSQQKFFSIEKLNFNNSTLSFSDLKTNCIFYVSIKKAERLPILIDTNYNQAFCKKSKTMLSLLFTNRLKNLFFKNSYFSCFQNLSLYKTMIFNKTNSTQFNFFSSYQETKLHFFIKTPPLIATYLKPNTYVISILIKNKSSKLINSDVLTRLTTKNYTNLNIKKFYKNTLLKPINLQINSLNLSFQSSSIYKIFKRVVKNKNTKNCSNNTLKLSVHHFNWIPKSSTILYSSFLSPYQGEVISQNLLKFVNQDSLYNQIMILTDKDKFCLSWFNVHYQERIIKSINYFISKPALTKIYSKKEYLIDSNTKISPGKILKNSGQILSITPINLNIRKGFPILSSNMGIFYVWDGDFINIGSPIMTLLYRKMRTGDIIQGIPKIEHFFEARKNIKGIGNSIQTNLSLKLLSFFFYFNKKLSLYRAVKRSFSKIQKIIIDGVCRVYCSQGIIISRKHFEIVVKQMTSKVKIVDGGETGLLEGELINFSKIERINQKLHFKRITYEPTVLGITKISLKTDSFISSASFQETTKVLSQSALEGKIDFLNGLKENVILGRLIPGGTGAIINITNIIH